MEKTYLLLLTGLLAFMAACSSDKNTPEPVPTNEWHIDNDTLKVSIVGVNTAPILTEIRAIAGGTPDNMLSFAFQMGGLPHSGTFKVDYVASTPDMCNVYVTYKGNKYDVSPVKNETRVSATALSNGKGKYQLEPTWFYRALTPSDSILVSAVLIEP